MTCAICGKAQSEHHTYQEATTTPPPTTGKPPLPAGFDRMIYIEGDMHQAMRPIETAKNGGWTPTSLLCISFVAVTHQTGQIGSVSIAPYPPPAQSCQREINISEVCGDFIYAKKGYDAGAQFQVGGTSRTSYVLTAGKRYFINYRWTDSSDARVQVSWPYGVA